MEKNKLLEKFISYSLGSYIAVIIGFLSTPIVTRLFSPSEFGIYSLVMVWINLISILVLLGFDHGYQRYYHEVKENEKLNLLKICLSYSLKLYFVILIVIFFFREDIKKILNINSSKDIGVILLVIILTIINRYFGITLVMQQQVKKYSLLQVLAQILNIILILILYYFYKDSYVVLLNATIVVILFTTIGYIFFTRKILVKKEEKFYFPKKEFFNYSFPMALTMGLNWIFQSIDKIAISYYSTSQELGYYSAAFKIISILIILQTSFTTFWNSISYEKYSKDSENKEFFEKNFLYVSFIMIFLAIVLLMMKKIIILFLGVEYKKAMEIIPFLLLMPIMQSISEVTGVGINFSKKTQYNTLISLNTAFFNILGNVLLVPEFGAKGAAISTGISYILFFILRTFFSVKLIEYKFNFKKIILGVLVLMLNIVINTNDILKNINFFIGFVSLIYLIALYREQVEEIRYELKKLFKERKS